MAMSAAATNGSCDIAIDAVDEALQRSESTFRSPRMIDVDDTDSFNEVEEPAIDRQSYTGRMISLLAFRCRSTAVLPMADRRA